MCRGVRRARHWQLAAPLVLLCLVPELELASAKRARKKRVPSGRGEADARPLGPSVFPEVLTAAECDELLSKAKQLPAAEGKVGVGGDKDTRTRRSTVRALPRGQFEETYATITTRVTEANDARWMFTGLRLQAMQLGEYTGDDHGFYDWHVDQSVTAADLDPATKRLLSARSASGWRVLSATLQLSDPANYTGGELLVGTGSAHRPAAERGTLVVFPSYVVHTVRPVRSGTRFSLVIWFDGVDPAYAENAAREQAANVAAIAESGESDAELTYELLAKTQHSLGKMDEAERSCSRAVQLHRDRSVRSGQLSYCRKLLAVTAFNSGRQEEGIQLQEAAVAEVFGTERWQTDSTVSGWTDPEKAATVETLATMMSKVSIKNGVVVPVCVHLNLTLRFVETQSGQETRAVELYRLCIARGTLSSALHTHLGMLLGKLSRLAEAEDSLSQAVALASSVRVNMFFGLPGWSAWQAVTCRLMIALYVLHPQVQEANEALPKHALSLAKLRRMDESVSVYSLAIESAHSAALNDKSRASLLAQRAMALDLLAGRTNEALASAREALRLDPTQPQAIALADRLGR